jgi:hypothetical protein
MQSKIDELESMIKHYEDNAKLYVADYQDTVQMPHNLSIREKIQWCYEKRNDGSEKLNRVYKDKNGCSIWTGRVRGGYAIIHAESRQYRMHTLAKVAQETPEITEAKWKDNLNLVKEYKNKTQVEKLVGAHSCHKKQCINPDHITFKTNAENRMDSFYAAQQTKGSEREQKLTYEYFLQLKDYKFIRKQLHEYIKSIGVEASDSWAYNLVRGEKYIQTPLGIEYKERLAEKWLDINAKNTRSIFPRCLK